MLYEVITDQQIHGHGAIDVVSDQQARPGHRRVRYGGDQLGVIGFAGAMIGFRPGPVEDEFTVGIVLEIEWCGADKGAGVIVYRDMLRIPSVSFADTVVTLEGGQELMTQELV